MRDTQSNIHHTVLTSSQPSILIIPLAQRSQRGYTGQCWKFPQARQSEADNFGGGPETFC